MDSNRSDRTGNFVPKIWTDNKSSLYTYSMRKLVVYLTKFSPMNRVQIILTYIFMVIFLYNVHIRKQEVIIIYVENKLKKYENLYLFDKLSFSLRKFFQFPSEI